jgi:hypothetical protein
MWLSCLLPHLPFKRRWQAVTNGMPTGSGPEGGPDSLQPGVLTILDRPGLEAAACECYRIIRLEYDRVLG